MILSNSRTLLEDIEEAKINGFDEEFIYVKNSIKGRNNKVTYEKHQCKMTEYCVHEGMSDPSDQSILFLIECDDDVKGCLSSSYGIYADPDLIEFCLAIGK